MTPAPKKKSMRETRKRSVVAETPSSTRLSHIKKTKRRRPTVGSILSQPISEAGISGHHQPVIAEDDMMSESTANSATVHDQPRPEGPGFFIQPHDSFLEKLTSQSTLLLQTVGFEGNYTISQETIDSIDDGSFESNHMILSEISRWAKDLWYGLVDPIENLKIYHFMPALTCSSRTKSTSQIRYAVRIAKANLLTARAFRTGNSWEMVVEGLLNIKEPGVPTSKDFLTSLVPVKHFSKMVYACENFFSSVNTSKASTNEFLRYILAASARFDRKRKYIQAHLENYIQIMEKICEQTEKAHGLCNAGHQSMVPFVNQPNFSRASSAGSSRSISDAPPVVPLNRTRQASEGYAESSRESITRLLKINNYTKKNPDYQVATLLWLVKTHSFWRHRSAMVKQ